MFIYFRDIFKVIRLGTPILFTDDIKIVCTFKAESFKSKLAVINEDLKSLDNGASSDL